MPRMAPSKDGVGVKDRTLNLNPWAQRLVTAQGVLTEGDGQRHFDFEGDGKEPFYRYKLADGRVLHEALTNHNGLHLCLLENGEVLPESL